MMQSSNLGWRMGAPNSSEGGGEGRTWSNDDPSGVGAGPGPLGVYPGEGCRSEDGTDPVGEVGCDREATSRRAR
jgi:hypothetical protein